MFLFALEYLKFRPNKLRKLLYETLCTSYSKEKKLMKEELTIVMESLKLGLVERSYLIGGK